MAVYVISKGYDVLAFTKSWLETDTDQLTINELVSAGYGFNQILRKSARRESGIGILYKSGLVSRGVRESGDKYIFGKHDCTTNILFYIVIFLLNKLALETRFSSLNCLKT